MLPRRLLGKLMPSLRTYESSLRSLRLGKSPDFLGKQRLISQSRKARQGKLSRAG
jgi:hypothetical protein